MRTQALAQVPASPLEQAQGQPQGGGGILGSPLLFIVAMLLIMYALIIRPQQRRDKEQKAMLAQIEKGDWIVSTGGIHGRVTGIAEDVLTVEIASNVRIKMNLSAVGTRLPKNSGDKT